MSAAAHESVEGALARGELWAVVDGASVPLLREELPAKGLELHCLYRLEPDDEVAAVAPYLVSLPPGNADAARLVSTGLGPYWGVLVETTLERRELIRALRGLTMVRNDRNDPVLFRFYDPRVLLRYLPAATPDQLDGWFRGISAWTAHDDREGVSTRFTREGTGLGAVTRPSV